MPPDPSTGDSDSTSSDVPPQAGTEPPSARRLARRSLLTGGLAAAWSGLTASRANASPAHDPLLALVHRVTQGFTLDEWELAQQLGYEGYLEHHLAPEGIDVEALETSIADEFPVLSMTPKECYDTYGPLAPGYMQGIPILSLQGATLLRSTFSGRQLFERMVEFWSDHFNVDINFGLGRQLKILEDREVIRPHALGSFNTLLLTDAKGAAMSYFLDNYANFASGPNENYAREVMELHTLGVDGPYHEQDVAELARAFTGWAFYPPQRPEYGDFLFRPQVHDFGAKSVIDLDIPAGGGVEDGELALSYLASHDSTAHFVGRKLAAWLLVYEPSDALVHRVAQAFHAGGDNIKSMVRVILDRDNLIAEEPWANPKLKRPYHFVVSLLRAVGAEVTATRTLIKHLADMRCEPFAWVTPDGYPDTIDDWGGTILPRWTFASELLAGQVGGVSVPFQNLTALLGSVPQGEVAFAIDRALTGGRMDPREVTAIQTFVSSFPGLSPVVVREAFALAASSPSFQFI